MMFPALANCAASSGRSGQRAIVAGGGFPMFEPLLSTNYDFDLDALFEFGLQRLLDGLAVVLDGPRPQISGSAVTP
jgi:hypothetical protein